MRWKRSSAGSTCSSASVPARASAGQSRQFRPSLGLRAAKARVACELLVHRFGQRSRASRQGLPDFRVGPSHIQGFGSGGWAVGVLEVENELRPEEAAHRRIRAGLRRVGVERGQQRKDGDQVPASAAHPAAQQLEIPQVGQRPAARRAERGQMGPDSPASVGVRPAPGLYRGGDHRAGIHPAADLYVETVVAQGQRGGRPQLGALGLERHDFAAGTPHLRMHRPASRQGNRSQASVPRDGHRRRQPSASRRAAGS